MTTPVDTVRRFYDALGNGDDCPFLLDCFRKTETIHEFEDGMRGSW